MKLWEGVLVIDDSKVYCKLMATLMAPYCQAVFTASSAAEGIAALDRELGIEVVLCDYVMNGGTGLDVLAHIQSKPEPRPRSVMLTGYPSDEVAHAAREHGAVACLSKPTNVRKIIRALKLTDSGERRTFNPRWRCSGKAYLVDDGVGYVVWDVYNISFDGAFLETKGPIPLGSELEIQLQLAGAKANVHARVVRVQEPSWMDVGGVGVEFLELSDLAEEVIRGAIASSEPEHS